MRAPSQELPSRASAGGEQSCGLCGWDARSCQCTSIIMMCLLYMFVICVHAKLHSVSWASSHHLCHASPGEGCALLCCGVACQPMIGTSTPPARYVAQFLEWQGCRNVVQKVRACHIVLTLSFAVTDNEYRLIYGPPLCTVPSYDQDLLWGCRVWKSKAKTP